MNSIELLPDRFKYMERHVPGAWYPGNALRPGPHQDALARIRAEEMETELYPKYHAYYRYGFYIAKKN